MIFSLNRFNVALMACLILPAAPFAAADDAPARDTVIVDRDGVVRYVEYIGELGEEPDYERAVAVARELAG